MRTSSRPSLPALALRSAALFIALYQVRIIAGELADTPFFIAALASAILLGIAAGRSRMPVPAALGALVLAPVLLRAVPLLAGAAVAAPLPALDALLPLLDRNAFVAQVPWYWAALGSFVAARSRSFLRIELILSNLIPVALFALNRSSDFSPYQLPVMMMGLFALFLVLQFLALILSSGEPLRPGRREGSGAALVVLLLIPAAAALLLKPSEEGLVDQGGGLLKPNLFRFDFSQFLRLESEISLSDDLALIVRKEEDDSRILLRRFVLSGYHPKRGFYRHEERDEAVHPQRLPDAPADYAGESIRMRRTIRQEYFLVNFDPSALIAMNRPVRVVPYRSWDATSFSSAYAAESEVSDALPFELMDAVPLPPAPENLGMSEEEYRWYTDYGNDERIAAYGREIVDGLEGYWDRVQAVYERLKYGEYRYSLKPGIAADGDQLGRFLFDSKRGYCSYFAFSMALLLRSQGIPARVAVGFFLDPQTEALGYYPVRSDMAHAWVEVPYPGYGWVEYDPTTDVLAEGEDLRFTRGVPQDLFERLMREILQNRNRLLPKEGSEQEGSKALLPALAASTARFFRAAWPYLLALVLLLLWAALRAGFFLAALTAGRRHRRAAAFLGAHAAARLALAGHRRSAAESPLEFARRLDASMELGLASLTEAHAAARFAPRFSADDLAALRSRYAAFSRAYGAAVPRTRRILAWMLPPLALLLPAARHGQRRRRSGAALGALIPALLAFGLLSADRGRAQEGSVPADRLYEEALEAQGAERWERAIELFKRGAEAYRDDARFPWALGDLYLSRKLYSLAWDEYRRAEILDPDDPELLYQLSNTAGRLNRNDLSASYLERVVDLRPEDRDAIGDLAWMYFKLHRLAEGEALLLDALARLGADRGFSMTLGTIYSDQFRYDESKERYLESIADAEREGAKIFSAVAHYNLSILESRHYKYAEAFARTIASLEAAERASGHLAKGELHLRRLEFPMAFAEYQAAYQVDSSPLSKINLAQAYQMAGRLEEARAYGEETLAARDLSWMLNYGTDEERHRRDLHEILANTYSGLAAAVKRTPAPTLAAFLRSLLDYGRYRIAAAAHGKLYAAYSLKTAQAFDAEGQRLDALVNYYNALKAHPARARHYLAAARDFETALIPEAAPSYDLEEGLLLGDRRRMATALSTLDPLWERDLMAEAYASLALPGFLGVDAERADAAERLYALNRGALRQRGIALPVLLEIEGPGGPESPSTAKIAQVLTSSLRRAGLAPAKGDGGRYVLRIAVGAEGAECELRDRQRGTAVVRRLVALPSLSRADRAAFASALADALFTAD